MNNTHRNRIRPIAISIIRKNEKILVYQREDDKTGEIFFRLVGGCIEFNESAEDALKREFDEELAVELTQINLITTFQSIFTFNNNSMHEIVFLFESEFKDKKNYDKKHLDGQEGSRKFSTIWLPCSDFINYSKILYPVETIDSI